MVSSTVRATKLGDMLTFVLPRKDSTYDLGEEMTTWNIPHGTNLLMIYIAL